MVLNRIWRSMFFVVLQLIVCQSLAQDSIANEYINNWKVFHDQEDYNEAIKQARILFKLGDDTENPALMAYAAYWEAQSLMGKSSRPRINSRIAKQRLREGLKQLQFTENAGLRKDILALLVDIAEKEENDLAKTIYSKQLENIQKRKEVEAYTRSLAEQVQLLDTQKDSLEKEVASLSEVQMKAELMLAMQNHLLDSLKMAGMEESFEQEKNAMLLKEQAQQLELQEQQIALQENELQLQSSQRNFFLAIAGLLAVLAIGAYLRFSGIRKYNAILEDKNQDLQVERAKSEELLLNILPSVVAEELKNTGVAQARRYESATVMFTDFKNFSAIAKEMKPEALVKELDIYFKAFDDIIAKYNLEKIKTIGDAYLCVGGLPDVEGNTPQDVVKAAFEIQQLLSELKANRAAAGLPYFEARIGIHSGPLVAGVVGSKKFAYDIWGDTVNIAARMESNGSPWQVNISEATYQLVKNDFQFDFRGILPIKNRGEVGMYFVKDKI